MKTVYVGVPILVPMPFTRRYRLERDLEVTWTHLGVARKVIVPQGFLTDGASVPRWLWPMIGSPYSPEFITAAIIHDYMCEVNWNVAEMSDLFCLLLLDANVDSGRADTMRFAVQFYKQHISK